MTLARASTDEERLNGGVGVSDTGCAETYFIPLFVNSPYCLHTLKTYVLIRIYPSLSKPSLVEWRYRLELL